MADIATLLLTGVGCAGLGVWGTHLQARGELKVKTAELDDLRAQRSERARQQRRERYAAFSAELGDRLEALGRAGSKILGCLSAPRSRALSGTRSPQSRRIPPRLAADAAAAIRRWMMDHAADTGDVAVDALWEQHRAALSKAIRDDLTSGD